MSEVMSWKARLAALVAISGTVALGCASSKPPQAHTSPGAMNDREASGAVDAPAGTLAQVPAATAPLRDIGYQLEWFVPAAATEGARFLDPADELILVHDGRNVLTAREASTGKRRWGVTLGTPVAKFVGNLRIGDRIFASSESDIQILSTATGELLERQRLAALANTKPLHLERMLIYGCATGEVLGHDIATGYKKWGHMLVGRITARPVQAGQRALAVSQTGEVIAIDPESGRGSRPKRPLYDGLANNPVADERLAVIAGLDQSIYGFNHNDLSQRWRIRTDRPLKDQPSLLDRTAYVAIPETGLRAIDGSTGNEKWTSAGVQGSVIATAGGDLIVWDGTTMRRLDAKTGDVIREAALPGAELIVLDEMVDGSMYIATTDGTVAKYSRRR